MNDEDLAQILKSLSWLEAFFFVIVMIIWIGCLLGYAATWRLK